MPAADSVQQLAQPTVAPIYEENTHDKQKDVHTGSIGFRICPYMDAQRPRRLRARGKIGVATAPSPIGPFKDALGRPLIEHCFPVAAVDEACGTPVGSGRNEKAIFTWFASRPIAQGRKGARSRPW